MRRTLLLLTLLVGCRAARPERPLLLPPPIENALAADAESFQKKERKAWFEELHKAPPELDWRSVERANGLRQLAKRNALALEPLTPRRWSERGSDNQAGRMHAVAPASDGLHLYAGSANGGLWKGSLAGSGWQPLGDNLYGGAHWLAALPGAAPGDPDVLLAATDGGLVHVTRDEGRTWAEPVGLEEGGSWAVRRVATSSDGSGAVFVLRRRAGAGSYQLFRSTDAMASFQKVLGLGQFAADVWVPRLGGSDVWVLSTTGIQRSTDGGSSFSVVGSLPVGGMSGGELVGSEAGAPRLWVVADVAGQRQLYRSDDAGGSWTLIDTLTDYWVSSLNASIVDADLFAYGGVECHVTRDAGASFDVVNGWGEYYGDPAVKLHADLPGIDVLFDGAGEVWYVNTDGGLYASTDQLASVQNLSLDGLRVSQYYTTLTSAANPDFVLAGAQDQGYQRASTAPGGGGLYAFAQLISGDYGHLSSADGDHDYVFSTYPGFVLCHLGETAANLVIENFPPGETLAWLPPVVADPYDERDYFLCATRLWRYDKIPGVRDWIGSVYSTFDFSAGQPNRYASALVFSPVDPERAYAATNDGRLFRSDDHGLTWTQAAGLGPSAHYFYGTAIVASALDVDTVYVAGSGYGSPAVYRSTDGGASFQPWGEGLPSTLVYCLAESRDGRGTMACGTETAAYRREPGDAAWEDVTGNQAPVTIYWSVEALPHENTMRFGTYGRGIWDYHLDWPTVRRAGGLQPR